MARHVAYDPQLLIKRGCVALATKPLHDCANADPEPAYTTNGASTRHVGSITAEVQAQLARNAVRADDKDRSASDGRSALDRTFLGIDNPPPTKTQRPEPANAVKRWPPSPADCPPPSSPSIFLLNERPDVDVWRTLVEYMCGGRGVRRQPGGTCGGYAWKGLLAAERHSRSLRQRPRAPHAYFAAPVRGRRAV